jgi:hypothetical protein
MDVAKSHHSRGEIPCFLKTRTQDVRIPGFLACSAIYIRLDDVGMGDGLACGYVAILQHHVSFVQRYLIMLHT